MKFIFVVLIRYALYPLEMYCSDYFYTHSQHNLNHNHNITITHFYAITNTAVHFSKKMQYPKPFIILYY